MLDGPYSDTAYCDSTTNESGVVCGFCCSTLSVPGSKRKVALFNALESGWEQHEWHTGGSIQYITVCPKCLGDPSRLARGGWGHFVRSPEPKKMKTLYREADGV